MEEIQECPLCLSKDSFESLAIKYRQGIDLEIPCNLNVPEISDCKLCIVDIPYFIIKCKTCGEKIKVIPAFITKGTTLTLAAQAFVSVSYHKTETETWRKVHKEICNPNDGIAHTTLYRGYLALGKNLEESQELLKEILNEGILTKLNIHIPQKALKDKTKQCEKMVIEFLVALWLSLNKGAERFWKNFWRLLENLTYQIISHKIFSPPNVLKNALDSS